MTATQRVHLLGGPRHGTVQTVLHGQPDLRVPVYRPITLRASAEPTSESIPIVDYRDAGVVTGQGVPIWTPDGKRLDRWRGIAEVWEPQPEMWVTKWFPMRRVLMDRWPEAERALVDALPGQTFDTVRFVRGSEEPVTTTGDATLYRFTARPWVRLYPVEARR